MATATQKTWAQLQMEIRESFRKWGGARNFTVSCPLTETGLGWKRRVAQRGLASEQRRVTLQYYWWDREAKVYQRVGLVISSGERAVDNLAAVARSVEMMRLADVRGDTRIITYLYAQMYPEFAGAMNSKPPQQTPPPSGAHAVLHIAPDAPLAVAEAAYRILMRQAHPDVGGSHEQAKQLNAAIEQIRAAKSQTV